MHLYLSPHADDAALSCGGQISHLTQQNENVMIFTLMIAYPPEELGKRECVDSRRKEDEQVANRLNTKLEFGPYLDAIYRVHPDTGVYLYRDGNNKPDVMDRDRHPHDTIRGDEQEFARFLQKNDVLHAPLGIFRHVDHCLVRDMAKLFAQTHSNEVYFYDDFPYNVQHPDAIESARIALGMPIEAVIHQLNKDEVNTRIGAIALYSTQFSGHHLRETIDRVYQSIKDVGGEREWRFRRNQ